MPGSIKGYYNNRLTPKNHHWVSGAVLKILTEREEVMHVSDILQALKEDTLFSDYKKANLVACLFDLTNKKRIHKVSSGWYKISPPTQEEVNAPRTVADKLRRTIIQYPNGQPITIHFIQENNPYGLTLAEIKHAIISLKRGGELLKLAGEGTGYHRVKTKVKKTKTLTVLRLKERKVARLSRDLAATLTEIEELRRNGSN